MNVLENYPRDELFQLDEDLLYHFALTVLQLDGSRACFRWRDRFNRFVSVVVYVPRERFDTSVRRRIGNYLAGVYGGRVSAFHPFFPEGPLVRVHFIIGLPEEGTADPSIRARAGGRGDRAPGSTSSASGWSGSTSRARPAGCSSAIARLSHKATGRATRRRLRSPTFA